MVSVVRNVLNIMTLPFRCSIAPKGYMCLVDHALAEGEVGVRQVGQRLQQDLWRHVGLEVRWVELVPAQTTNDGFTPQTHGEEQLPASCCHGNTGAIEGLCNLQLENCQVGLQVVSVFSRLCLHVTLQCRQVFWVVSGRDKDGWRGVCSGFPYVWRENRSCSIKSLILV